MKKREKEYVNHFFDKLKQNRSVVTADDMILDGILSDLWNLILFWKEKAKNEKQNKALVPLIDGLLNVNHYLNVFRNRIDFLVTENQEKDKENLHLRKRIEKLEEELKGYKLEKKING
jgi:hypothetical protein